MANPKTKTVQDATKAGFIKDYNYNWESTSFTDIQDWLRDEHNLHCSVAPWKDIQDEILEMYEGNVIDTENDWEISLINSYYSSYYDCLEACINLALKILNKRHAEKN